jgi:hypothetical protein
MHSLKYGIWEACEMASRQPGIWLLESLEYGSLKAAGSLEYGPGDG